MNNAQSSNRNCFVSNVYGFVSISKKKLHNIYKVCFVLIWYILNKKNGIPTRELKEWLLLNATIIKSPSSRSLIPFENLNSMYVQICKPFICDHDNLLFCIFFDIKKTEREKKNVQHKRNRRMRTVKFIP